MRHMSQYLLVYSVTLVQNLELTGRLAQVLHTMQQTEGHTSQEELMYEVKRISDTPSQCCSLWIAVFHTYA